MNISRRDWMLSAAAFSATAALAGPRRLFALGDPGHVGPGPETVIPQLMAGNARFVAGHMRENNSVMRRKELTTGQQPIVAVLACADSRVAPEIIFDHGLGEIFVCRVAGNVVEEYGLASMEYAVVALGVRTVMVLGHTSCGAVKAALDQEASRKLPGELPALTKHIWDGVHEGGNAPPKVESKDAQLEAAIEANVRRQVEILNASTALPKYVKAMGGIYSLETGKVTLFEQAKTA